LLAGTVAGGNNMRIGGISAPVAALVLALGAAGCGATVRAAVPGPSLYGYSVVQASAVPVDIYNYPSVYWNGSYSYLVGDSWYYPTANGWVVFQDEPRDLYRYRRNYVQTAPPSVQYYRTAPAYRGGVQVAPPAPRAPARPRVDYAPPSGPVQVAPPAPRYQAPVQTAPPARGRVQTAPRAPRRR